MIRRLSILISSFVAAASLGVSLSSCNEPSCGPGTVQMQQTDGTLKCVRTDETQGEIPCDTDGGNAVIVGGKCVSAIQCDPASTQLINGVCVGTGGSGGPICRAPASTKSCVQGSIIDFKTNMKASGALHLALWDPFTLITPGGQPLMTVDVADASKGYVFQDFSPPQFGIIVIVTGDGKTQAVVATGDQGVGSNTVYQVDAYTVPMTDVQGWGFDITSGGAYIAKFYNDPKPPATLVVASETHPVAGVTLTKDGANANAKYFNATLSAIDNTLTATGSSGTAIVAAPIPMGGMFSTFTGMGPMPPITWEMLPGGSAANLVFITRFHPNM